VDQPDQLAARQEDACAGLQDALADLGTRLEPLRRRLESSLFPAAGQGRAELAALAQRLRELAAQARQAMAGLEQHPELQKFLHQATLLKLRGLERLVQEAVAEPVEQLGQRVPEAVKAADEEQLPCAERPCALSTGS
jgi:hypothetical protein